ncbi:hypothetical protein IFM89_035134 [Coptis chinensis]|uniref:Uncharacterized protein n=1 Tax=Coptis chinensis TaxID=261450 RepID=A0A835MGI8_9MAGN|nr:hypothetical protein IFM89_035134 [Coptis chinensis]
MRGTKARTNFVYSDMPPGSSVTSLISPDEPPQHDFSALFDIPVPPQQGNSSTQPFFGQDCDDLYHFSGGEEPWIPAETLSQQHQQEPHSVMVNSSAGYDDEIQLPPLPFDIYNFSSNDMGQGEWLDTSCFTGLEEQSTGLAASYFGFDSSSEYVHSPLFGQMPPVSDSVPGVVDHLDLGSSAYFF